MKETPLSTCEKEFITQAVKQNQRLDGRKNDEFRNVKINYGSEYGNVLVALGETRVLAVVSCTLGEPKTNRPTEGILYINVEIGPMAAPHFEAGRNSELNVQINRTLERTFKDSRCLDLESLCVTAEERVWILRIDLNVLNHEGNLIDCCSIASLCALAHFRRPDVTISNDDVRIHTAAEKELIPMVLHHYPVCISYCTFDDGRLSVADPTAIEERSAESHLIFGINSFRELCCLNLGGKTLTSSNLLLQCAKRAANHAKFVVAFIKKSLEGDNEKRENSVPVGLTESLRQNTIATYGEDRLAMKLRYFHFEDLRTTQVDNDDGSSDAAMDELEPSTSGQQKQKIKGWIPAPEDNAHNDENIVDLESDNDADTDDEDDRIDYDKVNAARNNPIERKILTKDRFAAKRQQHQTATGGDSDSEEDVKVIL